MIRPGRGHFVFGDAIPLCWMQTAENPRTALPVPGTGNGCPAQGQG